MRRSTIFLLLLLLILSGCSNKQPLTKESSNNNETTNSSIINESTGVISEGALTLDTGKVIRVGDTVEAQVANCYECEIIYSGVIKDMYSETGRVLMRAKGGVIEFNYRYVVDIVATTKVESILDNEKEIKEISETIRAVVSLDSNGKETIAFLKSLDGSEVASDYVIFEMESYKELVFHDMLHVEQDIPQDVIDFYNS